jgi:hypothetical protein
MMESSKSAILARPDAREFLELLAANNVRYLVIGGCAVLRYAKPRYTGNIDLWIARDRDNASAVFSALEAFGAPLNGISREDFCQPGHFYQMGAPPLRIDDMLSIKGVPFEDAWAERETMNFDGLEVPFIGKKHLIEAKRAAGRPLDMVDLENLVNAADQLT